MPAAEEKNFMDKKFRTHHESISDLIDRMSILQLKVVFDAASRASYEEEMRRIEDDLDFLCTKATVVLDTMLIWLVVALAQINLHIWKTKEIMQSDPMRFNEKMKLAHQLNGIRNQLKNRIAEYSGGSSKQKKTNIGTDQLQGWSMYVLESEKIFLNAPTEARVSTIPLADLIDALTILQIKEVLLPAKHVEIAEEMQFVLQDIDSSLASSPVLSVGNMISPILFLAQINLIVWYNKDEMESCSGTAYNNLLEHAQELNGLRNEVRNILMESFREASPSRMHVTFLQYGTDRWYSGFLDRISRRVETINEQDIAFLFGVEMSDLPQQCLAIARSRDFRFRWVTGKTRDETLLTVLKRIHSDTLWVSGEHQKDVWEKGWSENLKEYKADGDISFLTPKFIRPNQILRFRGGYIQPLDEYFEFNLVDIYRHWLFVTYFSEVSAWYEFGCGSCQHVPVLANLFPDKKLYGLDWAQSSVDILEHLRRDKKWNVTGKLFNLFEPDASITLDHNSGIFTMGTMEQLGTTFEPFLQYLLKEKPSLVVHCETIREFYDESVLTDYVAILFDKKRNYLDGYITRLRALEAEGKISILVARRMEFGSMFHDSYSLIVWKPL